MIRKAIGRTGGEFSFRHLCVLLSVSVLITAGIGGRAKADPITIYGATGFNTVATTAIVNLQIPGDISGPDTIDLIGRAPSSPTPIDPTQVNLVGIAFAGSTTVVHSLQNALVSTGTGAVDTVVDVTTPVTLNNIGDVATAGFQILQLSLQGTAPVEIDTGAGPAYFDLLVDLNPTATQSLGSITFTQTGDGSGTFNFVLPESVRLTFTEQGNASNSFILDQELTFFGNGDFTGQQIPAPAATWLLPIGMGLLWYRRRSDRKSAKRS